MKKTIFRLFLNSNAGVVIRHLKIQKALPALICFNQYIDYHWLLINFPQRYQ